MSKQSRVCRGVDTIVAVAIMGAVWSIVLLAGCGSHGAATVSTRLAAPVAPVVVVAPAGVSVDGIGIGGQTIAAAKKSLLAAIDKPTDPIVFKLRNSYTGDYYHYTLKQFGGYFDVDSALAAALKASPGSAVSLPLKLDPDLVSLHVYRLAELWDVPVEEPHVTFLRDGERSILRGHPGHAVDVAASETAIMNGLPTLGKPTEIVDLPFDIALPRVNPKNVRGLGDVLTSFTTTFNPGNVTRTNNLMLAIKNINGTVVGPGEVFSYNNSVGPRTPQTGFEDAIIYVNDQMKKDVGGGICQGSSTLYNAVLLANLPIVERHAHSLPVHYVPAGRDATVAWGGDDFRFRNNTIKPIIVRAYATSGGTLTECLIGDRRALPHPNAQVAIDVTPIETEPDGFKCYSYRIVKENGVLIAKEPLGESYYHNLVGGVPH